jgi:hypothetical protein
MRSARPETKLPTRTKSLESTREFPPYFKRSHESGLPGEWLEE